MDKEKNKELKKKLKDKQSLLIANAKDPHFAEKTIKEILSLKGQIDVTPAHFVVEEKEVIDVLEGETFNIYVTNSGVHFHTKGGYDIFIDAKYKAACDLLSNYVIHKDYYKDLEGEMKEAYDIAFSAVTYILTAPMWVFYSQEKTFELATKIVEMLNATTEESEEEKDEK